ncbi:unnamed protein product [Adineta ricciae]|uniref:Apple domain-containing protein n=1 Tax=Adineta ricciae TaxID=249248 RepID=A0A816E2I0_ADIRI|nr:unnamed protein product [Adineta ricciae]
MTSRNTCLWILSVIITQLVGEDMRSVRMFAMRGRKFQCATTTCSPFASAVISTNIKCQMTCLAQVYCTAASFHQSNSSCELFTDMSNEIGNMLTDVDIITTIVIAGTRSPPEPTTTTTTSAATTSSTTETTSTSTSTTTPPIGRIPLAAVNGTIGAVYNTSVGGDSTASTSGYGIGQYPPGQSPEAAWDNDTSTKYLNFGSCTISDNNNQCGLNTGVYFELQRGSTVVRALQMYTGSDHSERDPLIVTLEGSNQSGSNLTLGSSWTLIYNGNSGLQNDPGRMGGGSIQQINNTISYRSYRFLVSGKRSASDSVQYSELVLYGY